jgi:hypothetical protein
MNPAWMAGAGGLAVYALLVILSRRPVGLRMARLGWLVLIVAALRLLLVPLGYPMRGTLEWVAWSGTLAAALIMNMCRRLWIVRVTADSLCEQVRWACAGLFLPCEEHEKTFRLGKHGAAQILTFVSLSRNWQLLLLPKQGGSAKVVLLLDWLSKQYPGPIPRIRLVLKRE